MESDDWAPRYRIKLAALLQGLTLLAFVQQAPCVLRRFRVFMFAFMDAWSALNHNELAIIEDFCRQLMNGFEERPRVQFHERLESQDSGSGQPGN